MLKARACTNPKFKKRTVKHDQAVKVGELGAPAPALDRNFCAVRTKKISFVLRQQHHSSFGKQLLLLFHVNTVRYLYHNSYSCALFVQCENAMRLTAFLQSTIDDLGDSGITSSTKSQSQ